MKFPLPIEVTQAISDKAVMKARSDMRARGWKSMSAINPFAAEGQVGLRTTLRYLMYQDRGTKARVMWELEGKRIPITDASGTHIITAKGVGQPGFVTLPGGVKQWRDQKWRHPGIKPKYFLENAISSSIKESQGLIQQSMMKILTGEQQ